MEKQLHKGQQVPDYVQQPFQSQPQQQQPIIMQSGLMVTENEPREGCRSNTRFVAFFDMGLSLISVIFSIVWMLAGGAYMYAAKGWLIFDMMLEFIALFCNLAEICVACTLYGSSDPTGKISPEKAVKRMRRWMRYNIFLVIFNFCLAIFNIVLDNGNFLPDLGKIVISFFRMALVAIVFQYIQELRKVETKCCRKGCFGDGCSAQENIGSVLLHTS